MIEICLKYDNMHIFGIINAFNGINNHVIDVKIACYHEDMPFYFVLASVSQHLQRGIMETS